ncbi:MAG: flagellar biosynthetic protein FliQ [Planctomycetota bacterium]|nr:flagellar biosynthetic protein FliQ [Planctomycetota bacterium]
MYSLEWATEIAQRTLLVAAELSLPVLGVGLVIGLLFSVLQAITQVHEQTISFIPKLFAVGTAVFLLLPWILGVMTSYMMEVFGRLGGVAGS